MKRNRNFYFIYTRRLIGLFIIGILHATLLYAGDFMGNYAILGFILMLCVKFRPKLLLVLSIAVLLIPVLMEVHDLLFPSQEMPVQQSGQLGENHGLLKRTMWISLIIGIAGCGFSLLVNIVPLQVNRLGYLLSFLGQQVGAPAISIFYITVIFLVFKTDTGRKVLRIFSLSAGWQ